MMQGLHKATTATKLSVGNLMNMLKTTPAESKQPKPMTKDKENEKTMEDKPKTTMNEAPTIPNDDTPTAPPKTIEVSSPAGSTKRNDWTKMKLNMTKMTAIAITMRMQSKAKAKAGKKMTLNNLMNMMIMPLAAKSSPAAMTTMEEPKMTMDEPKTMAQANETIDEDNTNEKTEGIRAKLRTNNIRHYFTIGRRDDTSISSTDGMTRNTNRDHRPP
jgi:hypothetical protein